MYAVKRKLESLFICKSLLVLLVGNMMHTGLYISLYQGLLFCIEMRQNKEKQTSVQLLDATA